ncbi:hypothetical protein CDG62_10490 [Acinetobacter sp. WCHA55]|jgi:NAD-dependent SIR2 family protein deacetylase|uniref:hypothetical protein n=1 Tax=Acinetobacter sp. WCHA55 TaxID=2004646 RepID=UPI000B3D108F|nr:hypothetical protein [Acinetobacter sp. WCHA55]AYA68743.1 hypothetical protein CDG62_10490 [Acinetobacter sp. WCHA55]
MSVKPNIPMKFECAHCNKIYLGQYQHLMRPHYPDCPSCEQPGLLLGIAVIEDLVKHPFFFVQNYFKQTLRKLNKPHL